MGDGFTMEVEVEMGFTIPFFIGLFIFPFHNEY